MKKALVATILGLATVVSTFAQGRVNLDTYNNAPYPVISYGAGAGGTQGNPINSTFNIGIYWVAGTPVIANDPSGVADPATLGLTLGTGLGSTTTIIGSSGLFSSTADFAMPGLSSGQATILIVAYNGATYADSLVRGHSAAFVITPAQLGAAPGLGSMPQFSVLPVPEPSTFALAGLGLASLLIFRRRK
jgi:hypothetical protein